MLKDEIMNKDRAERVENLEREIMQENKLKSGINIELKNRLKNAIISLDKGSNDVLRVIFFRHFAMSVRNEFYSSVMLLVVLYVVTPIVA